MDIETRKKIYIKSFIILFILAVFVKLRFSLLDGVNLLGPIRFLFYPLVWPALSLPLVFSLMRYFDRKRSWVRVLITGIIVEIILLGVVWLSVMTLVYMCFDACPENKAFWETTTIATGILHLVLGIFVPIRTFMKLRAS